jgi:hypothetical protein
VQGPVGVDAHGGREAAVGILVIEETVLVVPHVVVDILGQVLDIVFKGFDLLPALEIEAHLEQDVGHHDFLQVGIEPYHVAVAVDGVVALGHTRHVVHAGAPAAAPVGAVAPGVVELEPLVVGRQHGKHLVEAVVVAKLRVVEPFRPGHEVGACAGGVVAAEAVAAVGAYLAADEAVGVLLGIEVVERALEGEEALAIAAEHGDKRVVPHEDVAVVGRGDVAGDEARVVERLIDVFDAYLPGFPVHFDFLVVTFPVGAGQHLASLGKSAGHGFLHLGDAEGVFGHEGLAHVGVLVGQLVERRARRDEVLRPGQHGSQRRGDEQCVCDMLHFQVYVLS